MEPTVNDKRLRVSLAVVSAAALVAIAAWHQANETLDKSRTRAVASLLQPTALLLKENLALIKELQAEPFAEKDAGILASYLAKIRRDGVAKNAQMKQRLDQLAENNIAIVALISAHAPYAKTQAFTAEADKFRKYAAAWRDRWNSVMELFMAGGAYASAEVQFPKSFPDAVQEETARSH